MCLYNNYCAYVLQSFIFFYVPLGSVALQGSHECWCHFLHSWSWSGWYAPSWHQGGPLWSNTWKEGQLQHHAMASAMLAYRSTYRCVLSNKCPCTKFQGISPYRYNIMQFTSPVSAHAGWNSESCLSDHGHLRPLYHVQVHVQWHCMLSICTCMYTCSFGPFSRL